MANGLGLIIEQSNKLIISPQIYQALEIMQLALPELLEYINNELMENPLLEVEENYEQDLTAEDFPSKEQTVKQRNEEEDPWLDSVVNEVLREQDNWIASNQYENEHESSVFEGQWLDNNNLVDYLSEQLRFMEKAWKLTKQEFATAQFIIGNLDSNGYLTMSVEELGQILKISKEEALKALRIVQQLDPPGVGARDLKECLKLQFHLLPHCPPKMEQILDHLDDLAAGYYKKIAQAFGLKVQEVKNMGELLKLLDPKPGSRFDGSSDTKYIIPDATIKKIGDEYLVLVNEVDIPKLSINERYKKALRELDDQEVKKFVREKVSAGLNLIKCIENRRSTIHEVLNEIVRRQRDFLEYGFSALKPLTMKEIAETIGLHESTVSRVSANKYIDTPRGLFPAKCFFAGSIGREKEVTAEKIKEDLKKYIAEEDPAKPYSDQKLADLFAEQGIQIARRTIAKYREELRIPSSALRKKSK